MSASARTNENRQARRQLRYRLYFRLMDLSLVAGILGFVDFVVDRSIGTFPDGVSPLWYDIFGVIVISISFIIAPVLILARPLRDEYAELLWQRTTIVIVYTVTAIPLVIFIAAWITFLATKAEVAPFPFSLMMHESTWWAGMAGVWSWFCLLFVAIFQFLRWKDSK